MNPPVQFAFASYQGVIVREINAKGFVHSRMSNQHGEEEYKVRYWVDGKREDDWFYAFELDAA